jgi:hypothetical protein
MRTPRHHSLLRLLSRALLLGLLLGAIAFSNQRLLTHRRAAMPADRVAVGDLPPAVAFSTVVLGGFRGLLVDLLWLRSSRLQEDGRYFELTQLADWITRLEPHFVQVWAFHAWNLAYNVTTIIPEPEARWRWIEEAISLLRDRGIPRSGGDSRLYYELGWLFQGKLSGRGDPSVLYYRSRWKERVAAIISTPNGRLPVPVPADLEQRLFDGLSMRAHLMAQIDRDYIPLDWRLPEASAIYWAVMGRRAASPDHNINCDRMLYQSLTALYFSSSVSPRLDVAAQPGTTQSDFLRAVMQAYEEAAGHFRIHTIPAAYRHFLQKATIEGVAYLQPEVAAIAFARLQQLDGEAARSESVEKYAERMSKQINRSALTP